MILGWILGIISLGIIAVVPTGYVGVKTRLGAVTGTLQQGIHAKAPLGIESVTWLYARVAKDDVQAEAGSKDLQTIKTDIVVNYHINSKKADKIYSDIGDNNAISENIVKPAVSEVVKASIAKKTAEEILTKRQELKQDIDDKLTARLQPYNIVLDDVSIVNVDFSPEFNNAIEAKQVAEQRAKQAEFEALKATKDAEATVNKAKGDAESQRLQQQTLNADLLQKMWIDKWDGKLPSVVTDGNALLQLPQK